MYFTEVANKIAMSLLGSALLWVLGIGVVTVAIICMK